MESNRGVAYSEELRASAQRRVNFVRWLIRAMRERADNGFGVPYCNDDACIDREAADELERMIDGPSGA